MIMKFNEKLQKFMDLNGFGPEEMAKKLKVSRETVYNWTTEGKLPHRKRWDAIANVMGVSVNNLFYDILGGVEVLEHPNTEPMKHSNDIGLLKDLIEAQKEIIRLTKENDQLRRAIGAEKHGEVFR